MAQQKYRRSARRPQRTWTFARFLLIVGYGLVCAFLGVLFIMRQELQRVGIFGDKGAATKPGAVAPASSRPATATPQRKGGDLPEQVSPDGQRPASTLTPQEQPSATPPRTSASAASAPAHPGEITADEKRALDDILRSKR